MKMYSYGFRAIWIKDVNAYLATKNYVSSECYKNAGVPQGSVLGPLLFIIYIIDTTDDLDCFARFFADDTSLGYSSQNQLVIQNTLNSDLKKTTEMV